MGAAWDRAPALGLGIDVGWVTVSLSSLIVTSFTSGLTVLDGTGEAAVSGDSSFTSRGSAMGSGVLVSRTGLGDWKMGPAPSGSSPRTIDFPASSSIGISVVKLMLVTLGAKGGPELSR